MDLEGKVALITGAAKGMGKAFAEAFLKRKCKVCVADVLITQGESTVSEMNKKYGEGSAIFVKCDVRSEKEFEDAFKTAITWQGGVHFVVNNAGVFEEFDWKRTVDINFVGCIRGTLLGFRYMGKDQGKQGGLIINVASWAATTTFDVCPVYCATKHGVLGLSRCYGTQLHFDNTGVAVKAVCPKFVKTDLFDGILRGCLFPEEAQKILTSGTTIEPSYVAEGVIKLAQHGANGAVLKVSEHGYEYLY